MSKPDKDTPAPPALAVTAPAPPPPSVPADHHAVHRKLEHLLVALEQQGIVTGDVLANIRHTP
jgi:hypothetical protein